MSSDHDSLSPAAFGFYDPLPIPVWVFSTETLRILDANRAARDWLGYDDAALKSMTVADLRPAADRDRLKSQVRGFDGSDANAGIWTVISASGASYIASFNWRKIRFSGADAILATISDVTSVVSDIERNDRRGAEVLALRRRIERAEMDILSLFDALPGKMMLLSAYGHRIVAVTDEYSQAVMLPRESLVGRELFDVFPDDPDKSGADGSRNLAASLSRVESLKTSDVMNVQRYPVRRPDGAFEERFWLPRNKPVFSRSGELAYIIHRVEDVTELLAGSAAAAGDPDTGSAVGVDPTLLVTEARTALLSLRGRELQLRAAEALFDVGPWEHDLASGALSWAPRVFDIYGVPRGRPSPDFAGYVALVHPDDRAEMIANYERFVTVGEPEIRFEHRIIKADGDVAHVRGVGARHCVDGRDIVLGYVEDVTRLRTSETKLLEAARLQKVAGRIARLGSWRVVLKDPGIVWSAETAMIHDEPEGVAPSLESAINYYAPEYRDRIRDLFGRCAQEGRGFDDVLQLVTAKQRAIWVRVIGDAVSDAHGNIVAVEGAIQDVSDLVAARDASAALSARLHETLQHISQAFLLLDSEWRVLFVNDQAQLLLQRRADELMGKNVWQEFPDAVGTSFEQSYRRAVATHKAVSFEEYFQPLGMWFEVNAYPTPDGLAVYFRDVSKRRAQDAHLHLLESAVARLNDIVLITEAEPFDEPAGPRIVYVNDAFERRTGFSRAEAIGRTPRILQGPKTQRRELDRIRRALETWQPVRAELINYTKTGDEFWLELDITPVADDTGWFTHWVAVERDITDRKQAERLMRESDERLRLLAKATTDVIWDWDVLANTVWWNENLTTLFGHDPAKALPGPESWSGSLHPDDRTRVLRSIDLFIAGPDLVWQDEYRFLHADGSARTVIDRAFAIRDEGGRAVRLIGSMTDVTAQREVEDRLRQSQKLEAVGQLTGGVAHDFNNLLTVIMGNAEMLAEDLRELPQFAPLAEMIVSAAAKGAELTSRLLAFSRKQALQPQVLDIGSLVQGLESMLRRTLPESIDIEIVRAGGLWSAEVDPGQLEAALLNLALNARDAMPRAGCLTIEVRNALLDEEYVATEHGVLPGQYVVVVVTDTGEGIPPEIVGRIFEPFFTTKDVGKGSGLGLSMVYGFVKQSGGHIRVYSEVGQGSCFKLYFPRSYVPLNQTWSRDVRRRIVGGSETILVVEDNHLVREHLVRQLKGLGYKCLEAADGSQALQILRSTNDIDLLFTDVVMPGGLGGRELADTALQMRPYLKVLFTSGYTENSIIHGGRLDAGIELLSKPYRRDELAAKLRKILDPAGEGPGQGAR